MERIRFENDEYSIQVEVFDEEDGVTSNEIQCKLIELLTGIGYRFTDEMWDEVDYALDNIAFGTLEED